MYRQFILSILLISFIFSSFSPVVYSQQITPTVYLNGERLNFDVPPIIDNGHTLVPLRKIFESLKTNIEWDGNTQTVTAMKDDTIIQLTIGKKEAKVNGKLILLETAPVIINGRTLVPLRFVSESLGGTVNWDEETRSIYINSKEEILNVQTQIANMNHGIGYAQSKGEWIYYSNWGYDELIKEKLDGSQKKVLFNKGNVHSIFISGEWVYFLTGSGWNNYSLYKIKTDGTNLTKLHGPGVDSIYVVGDWIYFNVYGTTESGGFIPWQNIYRMKTNGTKKEKLYNGVANNLNVWDNWIYFLDEDGFMRKMKTDGSNNTIWSKEITNLFFTDEWIYYYKKSDNDNESGIYRMKEDGSLNELLSKEASERFNIQEDWIYFAKFRDDIEWQMYKTEDIRRIKLDGSMMQILVTQEHASHIFFNVSGKWIYYRTVNLYYKVDTDGKMKAWLSHYPDYLIPLKNGNEAKYVVAGQEMFIPQLINQQNNIRYIFLGDLIKKLGGSINDDRDKDLITINYHDIHIEIPVNKKQVFVNDQVISFETPLVIRTNGQIPLAQVHVICDLLELSTTLDESTQNMYINSK